MVMQNQILQTPVESKLESLLETHLALAYFRHLIRQARRRQKVQK